MPVPRSPLSLPVTGVVFLAWSALVLAAYLSAPLDLRALGTFFLGPEWRTTTAAGVAAALGRDAAGLAGLALLGAAFLGWGRPAAAWLGGRHPAPLRAHLSWIAGQAAGALLAMGLGMLGLLSRPPLWAALAAGAALAARRLRPAAPLSPATLPIRALRALGWLGIGTALLGALAPQIHLDALIHYQARPLAAWHAHRFTVAAFTPTDGYPQAFEHLQFFGLALHEAFPVKLLGWSGAAGALLLLDAFLASLGAGRAARALAVAACATMPMSVLLPAIGNNDCAVAHAALLAGWLARRSSRGALGFVAGWLLALKLPAALLAAPFLVLACAGPRGWLALAAAAACAAPWAARTWLGHGQPFFPLFRDAFPGFEAAAFRAGTATPANPFWFLAAPFAGGLGFASLPWNALLDPARAPASEFTPGIVAPALLWLLPAALLPPLSGWPFGGAQGQPRAESRGWRAALAAACLAWWAAGGGLLRYLWPVAPLVVAAALSRGGQGRAARWVLPAGAALALLQLLHAWSAMGVVPQPVPVALGAEPPRAYLARFTNPAGHYMEIADESRARFAGGRTYVLGDLKTYYWDGDFLVDALGVTPWITRALESSTSPERLRIAFRQAGVRHLVERAEGIEALRHAMPGALDWPPARLAVFEQFRRIHLRPAGTRAAPATGVFYTFFDVKD